MRWPKRVETAPPKDKSVAQHTQPDQQLPISMSMTATESISASASGPASKSMDYSISSSAQAHMSESGDTSNTSTIINVSATSAATASSGESQNRGIPVPTSISESSSSSLSQVSSPSAIQSSSSAQLNRNADANIPGNSKTSIEDGSNMNPNIASVSASTSNSASPDGEAPPPTSMLNEDLDDPGQDHAVPYDLSDDPNASIVWSPQNQQSTCEFTHTISNYSQKRESGCKKAEYSNTTIDSSGNRWRLIVYVNGNGRASNHHLSLFLQVADADDLPFGWKKAVSYVLTLEHPNGQSLGYAKRNPDKTFKLCPKAIDWGWSQFITSDRIQQDGYISDDSLTVRASVTVKSSSIAIDPEDAELYLKCAVEEGNAEAVEACLAQGASVNCQFKDDLYTPLHTACSSSASNGSLEVLNLLLKRGADGNACNKWRETPLLIAANNGHKAAVEALLKSGADPSMCSEAGWSALTFAAHKGYDEIVSSLLNAGAPVNCRVIEDLSTPLHKACAGGKEGHLSAVTQLLTGGADVHALNKWRETPLLTAANHGQAAAVQALLQAKADSRRCTDTGWSPLSIAAYKGHDDVVELLLEQGAPTEEADPTLSALLQAATKGLPNTVELLLRHGADHTVTTKKGDTALSILIEQNLIDAAVEMVTEYKASVPRCSRDRKKVQRARLLINHNLRMKQQNDDSDQDDSGENEKSALHDSGSSPKKAVSASSKKKKGKNSMSAEQKANAAADALILELDLADAKAKKEQDAATSKRNKKKVKKEKERQRKMQLEKLRREKEEKEEQEREKERRIKEEKERKLREAKAKEQKEFEMKEAAKRQKEAVARRKEREAREKKRLQKQKLESEKREKDILEQEKRDLERREKLEKEEHAEKMQELANAKDKPKQEYPDNTSNSGNISKRRWEKSNGIEESNLPAQTDEHASKGTVEDQLVKMANDVVGYIGFDPAAASSTPGSLMTEVSNESADQSHLVHPQIVEPAPVSLFREEKAKELLRRATANSQPPNPLSSIDINVVKTVIYKWIVRASYESKPFLDPLIPSWTDTDYLVSFLQRQLISESRKASNGIATNFEMMKEAGSFLSELSHSLAKEVVEYREKFSEAYPDNSDLNLKMLKRDVMENDGSLKVAVEWENRSISIPQANFQKLCNRYTGTSALVLSSVFALVKRYETMNILLSGTTLDYHLPVPVLSTLANELKVEIELWTDPLSVFGKNKFCGMFPDVDSLFGGLGPFTERNNALSMLLAKEGGSVAALPTSDSTTASFLTKKMLDIVEVTEGKGIPVSFAVFLPMQAFRDLGTSPTVEDLSLLDTRLLHSHKKFIRCFESLYPGQHNFIYGCPNGLPKPCGTGSLMLILQNDGARAQFPLNDQSIINIVRSLSGINPLAGTDVFHPSSPIAQPIGDISNLRNNSRRGFELVHDDNDDFSNAEEMVNGMLNSLNISMFQDNNTSQEVDIEAISLMGIRSNVSNSRRTSGRFG